MKRYISVLVIFLAATLATSSAFSNDQASLVRQNIELSGLDDFIEHVPGYIEMSLSQRLLTSENPEMEHEIYNLLIDSYNETNARENLFEYVQKNTDIKNLIAVNNWYQTGIAKNIAFEEEESSKPEAQAEILRFVAELQETPPSQDRIQLIQKLVSEANLVDHSMTILTGVMKGVMESINLSLPPEEQLGQDQINETINNLKPSIEPGIRQQIIISAFYTYRNISNTDLTLYLEHLTSKEGGKFLKIGTDAIAFVLREYFSGAGETIFQLAKSEAEALKQKGSL